MSNRREELIVLYLNHIKEKFNQTPDEEFLRKVTIGLGPAIYNADSSKVSGSDERELETVKNNFLIKKLGLPDSPDLMNSIKDVVNSYGVSERNKYRAVVYYMLAKHFNKEYVYS